MCECVHGEMALRVFHFRGASCFGLRFRVYRSMLLISYIKVSCLPWLKNQVTAANGFVSKETLRNTKLCFSFVNLLTD